MRCMRVRAKFRALTVVIAAIAAGGCAAAPAPGPAHPHPAGGGPIGYWTRSRLLGARPLRGPRYRQVPSPGQSPDAHPAVLALRVGALFIRESGGDHFCTTSVVASPARDLLITAAHCIHSGQGGSYRQDIVFIPDYRDGQAPFGIWTRSGTIVGVIGGYQEGGDTAATSYSSYLGAAVQRLYQQAVADQAQ